MSAATQTAHAAGAATALRTGPVAVTGAGGRIGRALGGRLADVPIDLRPLGRGDDLRTAFADAEIVVHLAGTLRPRPPDTYEDANLRTVERTVAALAGSTVRRVVFLSYVGADPRSPNAYLRAKGAAERSLYASGRDVVVLRCTHVFGPPSDPGPLLASLEADDRRRVRVIGGGAQRVAPVYVEDVVEAVARAALDPQAPHGRFDLPGTDELSMDDLARVVNGDGVAIRHVPPLLARLASRFRADLTPELVDVVAADSTADGGRVDRAFGLLRHGISEVFGAGERARPAAQASSSPSESA